MCTAGKGEKGPPFSLPRLLAPTRGFSSDSSEGGLSFIPCYFFISAVQILVDPTLGLLSKAQCLFPVPSPSKDKALG